MDIDRAAAGHASPGHLGRIIGRIREANRRRFSSADGWTNLRVLDFTFEERWIYLPELIQNAVDAGARRVSIDHGDDWLTLQHDGPEPLTEDSVIGLSGLFQSTKDVGTVGFMGIGFKSVFRRFQRVRISGFGWHFGFDVEVTTGEEFGDRQPDLLGTVLPFWDDAIAPPDQGFTTRFELRRPQEGMVSLASDIAHALPASDRTVLALLAHRGLQELRVGETRWTFGCREEGESQLTIFHQSSGVLTCQRTRGSRSLWNPSWKQGRTLDAFDHDLGFQLVVRSLKHLRVSALGADLLVTGEVDLGAFKHDAPRAERRPRP